MYGIAINCNYEAIIKRFQVTNTLNSTFTVMKLTIIQILHFAIMSRTIFNFHNFAIFSTQRCSGIYGFASLTLNSIYISFHNFYKACYAFLYYMYTAFVYNCYVNIIIIF